MTLRYLTAGESHGPALVGILEGLPAGIAVTTADLAAELARRRLGYGRSPRMDFESDRLEVLGGVRHGRTLGSPVALVIHNTEWPKWTQVMAVDPPNDAGAAAASARGATLTRPRPGHADLVGMQKYRFDDARDVLERASARETATRVALAVYAKALLAEVGVTVVSHVVSIGEVAVPDDALIPGPGDLTAIDADPVRCADPATSARMRERIEAARAGRDTLGGVVEVAAHGLPPGLGSHVHWDRKLDTRLAAALMSVQAFKGVEVGDGFRTAATPGSQAHDEIDAAEDAADDVGDGGGGGARFRRRTHRAGGIEGGMSTGEVLRVRAAMKPLSSLTQPLATVDVATGEPAEAITQRSDTCAVPRAGVVCEAVVALVLADALLEKTGGDHLAEVRRNLDAYVDDVRRRLPRPGGGEPAR
ncbi:chorismate synthase [soil metagenome]